MVATRKRVLGEFLLRRSQNDFPFALIECVRVGKVVFARVLGGHAVCRHFYSVGSSTLAELPDFDQSEI